MRQASCGFFLVVSFLNVLLCANVTAETRLKVNANSVMIRAAPSENSEIVTQVSDGDVLTTHKGYDGEWIEIIPPAGVNFWVYSELVKDGQAAVKAQVRAGPGINYRTVGDVEKGASVTIRGEYRDWLKIVPTPSCVLWVNRKYVDPIEQPIVKEKKPVVIEKKEIVKDRIDKPDKPVEKPNTQKAPKRESVERKIVTQPLVVSKTFAPPPLPGPNVYAETSAKPTSEDLIKDKLVGSREQGVAVQREGIVRPSGFLVWRRPSKYRLVQHDDNGTAATLCYVLGDESQMSGVDGQSVTIYGREYWIQGVRYSVVIPSQIVRKE